MYRSNPGWDLGDVKHAHLFCESAHRKAAFKNHRGSQRRMPLAVEDRSIRMAWAANRIWSYLWNHSRSARDGERQDQSVRSRIAGAGKREHVISPRRNRISAKGRVCRAGDCRRGPGFGCALLIEPPKPRLSGRPPHPSSRAPAHHHQSVAHRECHISYSVQPSHAQRMVSIGWISRFALRSTSTERHKNKCVLT